MNDIVEELRAAADDTNAVENASVAYLLQHAAGEIELLRGYRDNAESDAAIAHLLVDRYRMTDAEREAVELAYGKLTTDARYTAVAATLRGLLDRTATPPAPNGHAPRGSGSQPVGAAGCATAGREGQK